MKKLLMIFAILFAATSVSAQEIYKEVKRIQKQAETFANDTTKNLDERKIACFKYDAIYYLVDRASQEDRFTEYELGQQTDALIEFVNLYVKPFRRLPAHRPAPPDGEPRRWKQPDRP